MDKTKSFLGTQARTNLLKIKIKSRNISYKHVYN